MNNEYKLFYEAFSDHMNQYYLTLDQCIAFINGNDSAVPSETYTALADAYNMWQSARESVVTQGVRAEVVAEVAWQIGDISDRPRAESRWRVIEIADAIINAGLINDESEDIDEIVSHYLENKKMKKFKCILVRTQYQTVLVEATDWGEAVESACDRFDPDLLIENEYVEAYDVKEITK